MYYNIFVGYDLFQAIMYLQSCRLHLGFSLADMISILEELHKYIPVVSSTTQASMLVEGEVEECTVTDDKFHRLLFG